MSFEWSEEYSVKNRVIDEHHKHLFELFDAFESAANDGRDMAFIKATLMDIKEYTFYHFSFEERMMEAAEYPEYLAHKKLHIAFIEELDKLMDNFEALNSEALGQKTYQLMTNWLLHHIETVDQKYKPYINL